MTSPEILARLRLARTPREKTKPVGIAKRSEKMKGIMKEYKPLVKEYLKVNPECKIKMEGCTIKATAAHHTKGRIGADLIDVESWLPCCQNCNRVIEEKDSLAREKGFKKSRMGKVNKV